MHTATAALALSFLFLPSSARVIWMPEEFDPLAGSTPLARRDTSTCGGDTSLTPCGGALPSNFCCSAGTTCLVLSTGSSVTAALCCPIGQDCLNLSPISVSCHPEAQNATLLPNAQLHADPPQQLDTCGTGCCPMGYACQNNNCVAQTAPTPASSSTPSASASSFSTPSSTSSSSTATHTAGAGAGAAAGASRPLDGPTSASSDSDFDWKSFAAGLIPGLAIGAIIAACLILLIFRKKRHSSDSYIDEKHNNRDTLTDLGTLSRRPTMHGRSISEPQANPTGGYRTDFLRSTPPKAGDPLGTDTNGYSVDIRSPASRPITPSNSPPRVKALFSRSPFMIQTPSTPRSTQPPVPAHMKRGTLSFKISPVRALKKQKSMHSLRRQMTDASGVSGNSRSDSRERLRPSLSNSASTETIQVLMPSNEPYTPERPPQMAEVGPKPATTNYQSSDSAASTWRSTSDTSSSSPDERQPPQMQQTPYASSSRYPSEVHAYTTPTRPPIPRQPAPAFLSSPYTPTNYNTGGRGNGGLGVERKDTRRDTTFSAMMERAGLRKSDLLVGAGSKKT